MGSIPVPLIHALRLATPLGIELTTSSLDRVAGVTITPLLCDLDKQAAIENWKPSIPDRTFFVSWCEYSRLSIENGRYIGSEDVWEVKRAKVIGEQALEQLLEEWEIPLNGLTYWAKTILPM